jgi:hypothetical protein
MQSDHQPPRAASSRPESLLAALEQCHMQEAKRANMGGRISEECEEQAFQLDFLAQQVRQRAGFGELDIAMRVAPDLFKQLGDDRLAGGVVNAFGNSDDATAQLAGTSIFRKA